MEPEVNMIKNAIIARAKEVTMKYIECSKHLFMIEMIIKILSWITLTISTFCNLASFINSNMNNNDFRQHETSFKVLCIFNIIIFIGPIGLSIFIKLKLNKFELDNIKTLLFFSLIQRLCELYSK